MLNKLKKNNKKGFTLVELIVVLVILAILAALLIPALTGYIDKAKKKQVVAETRSCVMALQTYADEKYGKDGGNLIDTDDIKVDGTDKNAKEAIKDLADVKGDVQSFTVEGGKVVELVYYASDGKLQCEYKTNRASGTSTSDGEYDVKKIP